LADAPTTASARISSTTRSSSWYGSPTATTSVIAPSRAPASSAARGHRPGGGRGRSHRQRGAGRPATAVGGDHREFRFVRLEDQPDTADLGVTLVDAWQGRGLGSALLARLSERAVEVGVEYFTAEVLAKTGPCLLSWPPWAGSRPNRPARGHRPRRDRRTVPDGLAHIVRLPASAVWGSKTRPLVLAWAFMRPRSRPAQQCATANRSARSLRSMRRGLAPLPPSMPWDTERYTLGTSPTCSVRGRPRLCFQVKSGRCQQGSRIVSAAFAGLGCG
jgi:GNAT superfamily N-acetyltransferase